MNIKRIVFWIIFLGVLALIVWGLAVAMNKPINNTSLASPAPVSENDHTKGPSDAPVTLIEYSDFQCPACEDYYPYVERLMDESSSTVRLVYRHFPLSQHPNAVPAALASEAAAAQGNFWGMYEMLFKNNPRNGPQNPGFTDWTELADPTPVFVQFASRLGLDTKKFQEDLASSTLKQKILDQEKEGVDIGVNATPTFFLNGKAINNPNSYEQFKALVDQAIVKNTK